MKKISWDEYNRTVGDCQKHSGVYPPKTLYILKDEEKGKYLLSISKGLHKSSWSKDINSSKHFLTLKEAKDLAVKLPVDSTIMKVKAKSVLRPNQSGWISGEYSEIWLSDEKPVEKVKGEGAPYDKDNPQIRKFLKKYKKGRVTNKKEAEL